MSNPPDAPAALRCWFHRFGGGEPCGKTGRWWWPDPPNDAPGRAVLRAMRWCDEHRHDTDVRVDNARSLILNDPQQRTPCLTCGSEYHSAQNHADMDAHIARGGTLD